MRPFSKAAHLPITLAMVTTMATTMAVLCLLSCKSKTESSPTLAPPPRGKPLFDFSPKKVSVLEIHQSRPEKGTSWSAGFKNEKGRWTISSQTALNQDPLDNLADGNAINHFLDTLTTLTSTGTVGSESETPELSSLGLDPPLAFIRWTVDSVRYEISIGTSFRGQNPDGERFAKSNAYAGVFKIQGAALAMLALFDRFETIRNRVLLTLPYDAMDTIEWKPYLNAERVGHDWSASKKKLPKDFNDAMEAVSRLRIKSFIDDPAQAEKISKSISEKPEFQMTFGDRHGERIAIEAGTVSGSLFATESTRGTAVFELHPESKQHFAKLLVSSRPSSGTRSQAKKTH
jgi:hypothetical protein